MKKAIIVLLPVLFTAQACNFLFGDIFGEQGSGSRGIFVSTDSGQTWQESSKVNNDKTLAGAEVSRIVIENSKPNNLLAATTNAGVYASDDQGQKWLQLLPGFAAHDVFFNANNSEELFVAGARNKLASILKSQDRGATWVQIYNEPKGQAVVTSLIFDQRNAAIFYAGLSTGTVVRSLDFGETWNALHDFQDRIVRISLIGGGKNLYVLGRSHGLWRSQDSGNTWTELKLPANANRFNDVYLDPVGSGVIGLGTDKGLWRSFDNGSTWNELKLPVTPEVNDVSAVMINPQNSRQIFAAIRSTIYRSDDSGATWSIQSLPTARTVSAIAIDPSEPNRIYVGLQ